MGGRNKKAQLDETHFFSIPKHFRGRWRIYRNWLFVVVDEDSTKFYCQLVRKRTRPALETIINQIVKPGTHVKSDEHKAYYWLGKTTKKEYVSHADLPFIGMLLFAIRKSSKQKMARIQTR